MIFVFGSNLAGRHGKGAAQTAVTRYGAVMGKGSGFQGQSYAIPTKDFSIRPLDLGTIKRHVQEFIRFAQANPELEFYVTAIGTGLAGYKHREIAPMFLGAPPDRCTFPAEWKPYLNDLYKFREKGEQI
jgi:hypothetical protein